MKVSELTGPLLDYWVARADGWNVAELAGELKGRALYALAHSDRAVMVILADDQPYTGFGRWNPSTSWALAGPIIERERLQISPAGSDWAAASENVGVEEGGWSLGPTPLIAAMRAFVASKLGEEV